jgi:hypothetical protein
MRRTGWRSGRISSLKRSFMTTITLEVPDDLAVWLNAERQHVPELLRRAFVQEIENQAESGAAPIHREVINFLALNRRAGLFAGEHVKSVLDGEDGHRGAGFVGGAAYVGQ